MVAASSAMPATVSGRVGQRRAADAAVVEGDGAVAGRESVLLERPRLGGVAEAGDEQDRGAIAPVVDPEPVAGVQSSWS